MKKLFTKMTALFLSAVIIASSFSSSFNFFAFYAFADGTNNSEQITENFDATVESETASTANVYYCNSNHTHRKECSINTELCSCGSSSYIHSDACALYELYKGEEESNGIYFISDNRIEKIDDDIAPLTAEELNAIHKDKNLVTDEKGNLGLQLDVWTEGLMTDEPTEIVLIADQSGSMYQAADGPDSYLTYKEFIARDNAEERERCASNPGYYMVITENVRWDTESTAKNWNNVVDSDYKYAIALVRWNKELNRWERSMQVQVGLDSQYTDLDVNPTFRDIENMQWATLSGANYDGTKAKYFKSLYGASVDAYHTLLSKIQNNKNAKMAIVGFSSPRAYGEQFIVGEYKDGVQYSNNYGGTGIFVNSEFKHANNLTTADYQNAWMSVATQNDKITAALSNILANYNETCTEDGFLLANELFKSSPNNVTNRVVVLFTDGEPTVISTDIIGERAGLALGRNYAIASAYNTKNTYNATVYAYGHHTIISDANTETFMKHVSSTYPFATSMTTDGGEFYDRNYYGFASNAEMLDKAFGDIAEAIFVKNESLSRDTIIRDVVTKYFDIDGEFNQGEIKVYDVPYVQFSDGTLGFETDKSKWIDITDVVNVTVNGQTVDITGYDFPESSLNYEQVLGSKLVIEIPIIRDPEFIGGNHVETNTIESGIYQSNGNIATTFPIPETDVKLTEITANITDMNLYFGSEEAENFTVADLQGSATVSVNGFILDLSKPDEDYGLDWQDDYADITVTILDENGNEFVDGFHDLREDVTYSIKVTVDPIYEGTETSVGTSNTADISIYYPELTFSDSYHNYDDPVPSDSAMSSTNLLSTQTRWKNANGVYSYTVNMDSKSVPELNLTYSLDYHGNTLQENNIAVNATVSSVGYAENVQNICYFIWKPCIPECGLSIANHYGNENSYEFYLHIKQGVIPDSVVIDYGLPVKISVLANDNSGKSGALTVIGTELQADTQLNGTPYSESRLADGVTSNLVLSNGNAFIEDNKVVFTPTNLEMGKENVFYYEYRTVDGEYYYATVTVIPATTIYYEDTFFTFNDGDGYTWKTAGEAITDMFQAEDRPGSIDVADADNSYGRDPAYDNSYTYSLGSSRYTSVDANSVGKEPTAEFTFCGTGFDLFSVTNSNTGAVLVTVYKSDGKLYKNYIVHTYYGYSYEDGVFKPNPDSTDSLYHVPVISARELGYDTYKVVIKPIYSKVFDMHYDKTEGAVNSYDIYVDSVRIYDPAGVNIDENSVIGNAYLQDGEYAPEYLEIRRNVLTANGFYDQELEGTEFGKGSIFIDSIGAVDGSGISDKFLKAGPNNELYLAKGQAIAFHIVSDTEFTLSNVQLGMKLVKADNATIENGGAAEIVIMNTNDLIYNKIEVSSTHEMYRRINAAIVWDLDVLSETGKYQTKYPIVIANTSDSIVSLTGFKWSYTAAPETISSGLTLAVTSTTPTQALSATQNALAEAEKKSPFEDECIALSWSGRNFVEGDSATLSITTPAEIVNVAVDGTMVEKCRLDENGNKIWTYTFEVTKVGENVFDVVLYDGDGNSSNPITTESITVQEKILTADDIKIIWSDKEFKEGKDATLIVTTPAKVEKVTVDGIEIKEFKLNEDGTKCWEYTFTVKEAGENSYEVLLYDAEGVISEAIETESITVNEKTFIEKIIELFIKIIRLIWGIF